MGGPTLPPGWLQPFRPRVPACLGGNELMSVQVPGPGSGLDKGLLFRVGPAFQAGCIENLPGEKGSRHLAAGLA